MNERIYRCLEYTGILLRSARTESLYLENNAQRKSRDESIKHNGKHKKGNHEHKMLKTDANPET
jgi:hypothetical protein